MPTFKELQSRLSETTNKKLVLQHLVEYLDHNFKPFAGADKPTKMLKADDGTSVPQTAFEAVIQDLLNGVKACEGVITEVDNSTLQPTPPQQPVPAAVTQEPPSEPGNADGELPVVPFTGGDASGGTGSRRRRPTAE